MRDKLIQALLFRAQVLLRQPWVITILGEQMSTKWVILLALVALVLAGQAIFRDVPHPIQAPVLHSSWQAATPYPLESDVPAELVVVETPVIPPTLTVPRHPSEAGQNMVLIIGAILLVLVVFLGVAANGRKTGHSE